MTCGSALNIDFTALLAKKGRKVIEAILHAISLVFANKRNPAKCLFAGILGWA
jgi:hypothetical protein